MLVYIYAHVRLCGVCIVRTDVMKSRIYIVRVCVFSYYIMRDTRILGGAVFYEPNLSILTVYADDCYYGYPAINNNQCGRNCLRESFGQV